MNRITTVPFSVLLASMQTGKYTPEGMGIEIDMNGATITRLASVQPDGFPLDGQVNDNDMFVFSTDTDATPLTDNTIDMIGLVKFKGGELLFGLQDGAYPDEKVEQFARLVDAGVKIGECDMNAVVTDIKQRRFWATPIEDGGHFKIRDVSRLIRGAATVNDELVVLNIDGYACLLEIDMAKKFLDGEPVDMRAIAAFRIGDGKLSPVKNHIAYIDDGKLFLHDLKGEWLGEFRIGKNRYVKEAVDMNGEPIPGYTTEVRLTGDGRITTSTVKISAKQTFANKPSFQTAYGVEAIGA